MSETPALEQLMGAYFHQDWRSDSRDEWGVLDLFISDEPELARHLPAEIGSTLQRFRTEAELEHHVIDTLGGSFRANWDGGTYRGWLTRVAEHVERVSGER